MREEGVQVSLGEIEHRGSLEDSVSSISGSTPAIVSTGNISEEGVRYIKAFERQLTDAA